MKGYALRQPVVAAQGEARDFTDIATELARRTGLFGEIQRLDQPRCKGVPAQGGSWDFSLDTKRAHGRDEIWDAVCKGGQRELSDGKEVHDLAWWRSMPATKRFRTRTGICSLPTGLRRVCVSSCRTRSACTGLEKSSGNRLHENGMHWWTKQLAEYQTLPRWKDFPACGKNPW